MGAIFQLWILTILPLLIIGITEMSTSRKVTKTKQRTYSGNQVAIGRRQTQRYRIIKRWRRMVHRSATQELAIPQDNCDIKTCQSSSFHLWQKYENKERDVLEVFRALGMDYFRSRQYRDEFCQVFYTHQSTCLKKYCTEGALSMLPSSYWSLHSQAQKEDIVFDYAPIAIMEHRIFEGQPDFYIHPQFLKVICTADWLPTIPLKDWCPQANDSDIRSYSMILDFVIRTNLSNDTCDDMKWRTNVLAKLLYNCCGEQRVAIFFCHYHQEIFRLQHHLLPTDCPTECTIREIEAADIPPEIICQWSADGDPLPDECASYDYYWDASSSGSWSFGATYEAVLWSLPLAILSSLIAVIGARRINGA